jgi:gamma-glutamylaminecyclotransferase
MTELVFVYGSLRRDQSNHGWIVGGRFLGLHRTGPYFTMRDLGAFPAVTPGGDSEILGEVYAVSPAMLQRLDQLEGCPGFYYRRQLVTRWGSVWIYLLPAHVAHDAPRVPQGDWVEWLTERDACCLEIGRDEC